MVRIKSFWTSETGDHNHFFTKTGFGTLHGFANGIQIFGISWRSQKVDYGLPFCMSRNLGGGCGTFHVIDFIIVDTRTLLFASFRARNRTAELLSLETSY